MRKLAAGLLALALSGAQAEPLTLRVDATAPVPELVSGHLKLGSSPGLAVNSQYLMLKGKPWLPVMGEFHYSRSPAASWAAELQKMKSAGIDIVASYVIWNHHEPQNGHISWQGNRDLRRFVQLAQQAGLKAMVRIGPWVHAEARYGGMPDWVVDAMPTRGNDAQYLQAVERFYAEIGRQLQGLLWKDGGPVVGIQIENEYNLTGPGQGAEHILELKRLALKAGLDVPLYTVTGWDGAVYPSGDVTPVFGGYPDAPWGKGMEELPPRETYAFRFGSRVAADLGAQTAATARGTAETDAALTPFLGAEYGAGLPAMYRRRTLVSAQDIAAMLPVQLGSGVNLLGYYMFHGGRNPPGSWEESSHSGGYNDTPRISYDFNAPLGPDGQQREVLARLRPFHYFLQAFGDRLAPMSVRKPEQVPADARDLKTPRWSVRAQGDSAFVFVNNHVRQHAMPEFADVRFSVALPGATVTFPRQGLSLRNGEHFIWPVNFALDGTRLVYATAQPVTRFETGDAVVHVFAAAEGQPLELAFPAADAAFIDAPGEQADGLVVYAGLKPGTAPALTIRKPGRRLEHVLVLSAAQSRQLVMGTLAGRPRLLLTEGQAWFTAQGRLELRSVGEPRLRYAMYPATDRKPGARDGLFSVYELEAEPSKLAAQLTPTRPAGKAPPLLRGGLAGAALQPMPEAFRAAAGWRIAILGKAGKAVEEVLLQPDFVGDFARLFRGTEMLDDWYYSGQLWQVGVKALLGTPLNLAVMPLRADAPIYLPREHRPDFKGQPQIAELRGVQLIPVYRWTLN